MWKQLGIAAALAGAVGVGHAQSSVTIYGLVDTGVEHLTNVGPSRSSTTRMPDLAASAPSRIGFRGRESLGNGLSVGFTLEMGMAMTDGSLAQGGRAFGRQSFLSLNGPWGSVGLGRQYTMLFWSMLDADVIGAGAHSIATLDAYFPNARADNAITYKGTFSGLTVGAGYSTGRDAINAGPSPAGTNCRGVNPNDRKECQEWSALLKYDAPSWGLALAHDAQRGGPGAFGGLNSSSKADNRTMLNGYATFDGGIKLGAGYMRRTNDGNAKSPRSNLAFLGASYSTGPWVVAGEYYQLKYASNADKGQYLTVRTTYKFSKRTNVFASVGHMKNSGNAAFSASAGRAGGNPLPGGSQTAFLIGVQHAF